MQQECNHSPSPLFSSIVQHIVLVLKRELLHVYDMSRDVAWTVKTFQQIFWHWPNSLDKLYQYVETNYFSFLIFTCRLALLHRVSKFLRRTSCTLKLTTSNYYWMPLFSVRLYKTLKETFILLQEPDLKTFRLFFCLLFSSQAILFSFCVISISFLSFFLVEDYYCK